MNARGGCFAGHNTTLWGGKGGTPMSTMTCVVLASNSSSPRHRHGRRDPLSSSNAEEGTWCVTTTNCTFFGWVEKETHQRQMSWSGKKVLGMSGLSIAKTRLVTKSLSEVKNYQDCITF